MRNAQFLSAYDVASRSSTVKLSAAARMEAWSISLTVSPVRNAAGKITGVSKLRGTLARVRRRSTSVYSLFKTKSGDALPMSCTTRPHSIWWQSAST